MYTLSPETKHSSCTYLCQNWLPLKKNHAITRSGSLEIEKPHQHLKSNQARTRNRPSILRLLNPIQQPKYWKEYTQWAPKQRQPNIEPVKKCLTFKGLYTACARSPGRETNSSARQRTHSQSSQPATAHAPKVSLCPL